MSKYLDPKYDLTFKKVFGEHKNLVLSLLNALLPLSGDKSIADLEYLDPEQIPENPAKKYSIVDVKCKDNNGRYFIVEMQMYWNSAFFMRTLYNTTKVYSSQLQKADSFSELKSVYALSIVNDKAFPMFNDNDEVFQEYYIINKKHPADDVRDDIGLVFVELPKFKPTTKSDKLLQTLWLKFLTEINESTTDVDTDLLKHPETAEALGIMERAAYTDEELARYEKQKLDEITGRSALEAANAEGKAEGLAEGRAEGLVKGRAEGLVEGEAKGLAKGRAEEQAKAHEDKLQSAYEFYTAGAMTIEQIASIMKLNTDELSEYIASRQRK